MKPIRFEVAKVVPEIAGAGHQREREESLDRAQHEREVPDLSREQNAREQQEVLGPRPGTQRLDQGDDHLRRPLRRLPDGNIASSTTWHRAWPIAMCPSWTRGVTAWGVTSA